MKVLFIARPDLYVNRGGDTVQIDSTAKYLRRLNVEVDIKLGHKSIIYSDYDLLHFFNIINPEDIIGHAMRCKKKYLISTIYVDYSEYDRKYRTDIVGKLAPFFSYNTVEYFKTIAKILLKGERVSSFHFFLKGHKGSIQYLLKNAACLLPNSHSEYNRLKKDYGIEKKYFVIPNAIDAEIFKHDTNLQQREGILCVAQIEGRKNQRNLVKAMRNIALKLTCIGKSSPNQTKYAEQCKANASANITFINHIEQSRLVDYYRNAKVHILPSWFETTGLSSLEAAAMGCNIVVSDKGDVKEYFGDKVFYCDPADPDSIKETILRAYKAEPDNSLRELIFNKFTWEKAAEETYKAYKDVLNIAT